MTIFIIIILIGILFLLVFSTLSDKRTSEQVQKDEEEIERIKIEQKEKEERIEKILKETRQLNKKRATTIKKVMIIGSDSNSRKSFVSSTFRGAAGGAILGPVGAISGALSGKNKVTNQTTFLIEFEDGHKESKTVDNNSDEFKKLCEKIEI